MQGYYRTPTLHKNLVIFVADNDLWHIPREGGDAARLTSGLAKAETPAISPDGNWIAFTGYDEGHGEVYLMPALGGQPQRMTFIGPGANVVGWTADQKIIYSSNAGTPFYQKKLYTLDPKTQTSTRIKCGPANAISYAPKGKANVIQRHGYGYVSWKRYRGGTAAELWVDLKGDGEYKKLLDLDSNCLNPLWIENRIYFISDHEGHGNIYSCTPEGKDIKRHTHHEDSFVRSMHHHGKNITYGAGGDLYICDLQAKSSSKIDVKFQSSAAHRARKFVEADEFLTDAHLNRTGQRTAIISRGRPFSFANWEGAVRQHGEVEGRRYRHVAWHHNDKQLIVVSDRDGQDCLEIHENEPLKKPKILKGLDLGRILSLSPAPNSDQVALTNHKCQLIVVDLKTKKIKEVDHSPFWEIQGVSWSPDGNWLAYGYTFSRHRTCLKLANLKSGKTHQITNPVLSDSYPHFDPDGKYLYFVSRRLYSPVSDGMQFEWGFPKGMRPYLITLQKETSSPFVPALAEETAKQEEKKGKKKKKSEDLKIDLEGIENRIIEFPVAEGRYGKIIGLKGKVMYGSISSASDDKGGQSATLKVYDFSQQKEDALVANIEAFDVSQSGEWMIVLTEGRLRVIKAGEKPQDGDTSYKKGGWLALDRVRISVSPPHEWKQIFDETWRLQKDFFWTEDMSKVNWDSIYKRYSPLLDRVMSREDLSDLIAEMHGELGSSHAYVFGGDFPETTHYPQGDLGAHFEYDKKKKGYVLKSIDQGDPWNTRASSPLARAGISMKIGDTLVAMNGLTLDDKRTPGKLLVNQANNDVELTYQSGRKTHSTTVKTLASAGMARYRDWVAKNREIVHQKTKGRVGYIHVPDMQRWGFAEFHRSFMAEIDREGLIVDVRYNGGGNVSPLLLEKLSRRRLGFDQTRWFGKIPYPEDSPQGPMVALTNEYAGSDGDMFSHSFKTLGLGPLIGKRTWGGVIGIWPRHSELVDGGVTTQPEFSYWAHDVGWSMENYGTDPDIEVEYLPQDYEAGKDPQLARGIEEVLKIMKNSKPVSSTARPNLKPGKLPK